MREASDPLVASALRRVAREDPELAALADAALTCLAPDAGPQTVSQHALQTFLWHELPAEWPGPRSHWQRVADALARVLNLLGFQRYAAVCRSGVTRDVLDAWSRDEQRGLEAFRKAMQSSGVEPPDLPELAWGDVMGVAEHCAHEDVSVALELACASGMLRPGGRGWRSRQDDLTRHALTLPRPGLDGRSHLDEIRAERVAGWIAAGGPTRRALTREIEGRLARAGSRPEDLTGLEPLRLLLERSQRRIPLTENGNLNRAFVGEAAHRFGWWDLPRAPRSEEEVRPLFLLHAFARQIGAVRREQRRAVLTREGQRILDDLEELWRAVARGLWPADGFQSAVAELVLLILLAEGTRREAALESEIASVLTGYGWRDVETGEPPSLDDVRDGIWRFAWPAEALGLLVVDDHHALLALTALGEETAIEALRMRATAPRHA